MNELPPLPLNKMTDFSCRGPSMEGQHADGLGSTPPSFNYHPQSDIRLTHIIWFSLLSLAGPTRGITSLLTHIHADGHNQAWKPPRIITVICFLFHSPENSRDVWILALSGGEQEALRIIFLPGSSNIGLTRVLCPAETVLYVLFSDLQL